MKKISLVVASILIFTFCALPVSASSTKTISVDIVDCNAVSIIKGSDKTITAEYDSDKFIVSINDQSVSVKKKPDITLGLMNRVTICIPENLFDTLAVNASSSGIGLHGFNKNIIMIGDNSTISAELPANYDKNMTMNNTNGVVKVILNSKMDNYKASLSVSGGVTKIPDAWSAIDWNSAYSYTKGSPTAQINITTSNTVVTIVS